MHLRCQSQPLFVFITFNFLSPDTDVKLDNLIIRCSMPTDMAYGT